MEAKLKAYEEQQKEIKRIKSIIQIQKNRRTEKSVKMAESKQKLLKKMEIIEKPVINNKSINLRFDFDLESGNDVLTVKNLSLRFDRQIFSNVSFEIKKGKNCPFRAKRNRKKLSFKNISGRN
nr:hypothetical protein [Thermoanaerobacter siderophilus]